MIPVLYLHGFASSPGSAKIAALRPLVEPAGIELVTPDLNAPSFEALDFDAMVARAEEWARRTSPRAVAGSSLGALVALALARRGVAAPLVLIAPALGVAERWRNNAPAGDPVMVFNHARNAEAPIHRAFIEQMGRCTVDVDPPPVRVTLIMGREDETVPFQSVRGAWEQWVESGRLVPGSLFIEIAGGDHGLVDHADVIHSAIVEAVR